MAVASVPTLRQALAADIAEVFSREFHGSLRQGTHRVPALVQDSASTVVDSFGGADPIDIQNVVILASNAQTLNLTEGEVVFLSIDGTPEKEKKKILVSSILSPDEVAINITTRSA